MTAKLRSAYDAEVTHYRAARAAADTKAAWHHLERIHIIGQSKLGLHLHSHWLMLGFAGHLRQPGEIMGQLFRLVLAPIGNLTGRLPRGNIGRSSVSAFVAMDIPDDLQPIIAESRS